jgi:hypothetical protein
LLVLAFPSPNSPSGNADVVSFYLTRRVVRAAFGVRTMIVAGDRIGIASQAFGPAASLTPSDALHTSAAVVRHWPLRSSSQPKRTDPSPTRLGGWCVWNLQKPGSSSARAARSRRLFGPLREEFHSLRLLVAQRKGACGLDLQMAGGYWTATA